MPLIRMVEWSLDRFVDASHNASKRLDEFMGSGWDHISSRFLSFQRFLFPYFQFLFPCFQVYPFFLFYGFLLGVVSGFRLTMLDPLAKVCLISSYIFVVPCTNNLWMEYKNYFLFESFNGSQLQSSSSSLSFRPWSSWKRLREIGAPIGQ